MFPVVLKMFNIYHYDMCEAAAKIDIFISLYLFTIALTVC